MSKSKNEKDDEYEEKRTVFLTSDENIGFDERDDEDEREQDIENAYFERIDIIESIRQELLEYVKSVNLPLCDYISQETFLEFVEYCMPY